MTVYSRRDFGKIALAGLPLSLAAAELNSKFGGVALADINSKFGGVRIGVQSYSFRTMPLDDAIKAMVEIGIGECELFSGHVEPRPQMGGPRPQGQPPTGGPNQGGQSGQSAPPAQGAPPAGAQRGPNPAAREEMRKWRLTVPMDHFTAIRKKFDAAGIK